MKWLFFILLKNLYLVYYPVEIVDCGQNIQVLYQNDLHIMELFNVQVHDMSRACELLESASIVEVAFEPNIQQTEVLSVWVFVDDVLLQQVLVDEGGASVLRKNPTYQYQLDVKEEMVSAPLHMAIEVNRSRGFQIVVLHFVICVLCMIVTKVVKY